MKKTLIGLSLLISHACWATDSYNPSNNQLSIPKVEVAGTYYKNVVITVKDVLSVDGGNSIGASDTYNANTNQLFIPSVSVNGKIYTNVKITVLNILSVGTQIMSTSYLNAKENYSSPINFPTEVIDQLNGAPITYASADFSQTGNIDLFTAFQKYHPPSGNYAGVTQSEAITNNEYQSEFAFWRKNQDGSYYKLTSMVGCLHPRKALVADFNQDSYPDVWVACTGYDSGTYPGEQSRLLMSDGHGGFTQLLVDSVGYHHASAAADVNNDGYPDVVSTEFSKPLYILFNNKDGTFTRDNSRISGSLYTGYTALEFIDIDSDGSIDLLIGLGDEGKNKDSTRILFGDKSGYFGKRISILPPIPGRGVVLDFLVGLDNNTKTKGLFINRSADGSDSVCFYCSETVQWVDLSDMKSSLVLDRVSIQQGPYYIYGPTWTPWSIPANKNNLSGLLSYWSINKSFVYK